MDPCDMRLVGSRSENRGYGKCRKNDSRQDSGEHIVALAKISLFIANVTRILLSHCI